MNRSVFLGVLGVTVGLYACGGDTDVTLGTDSGTDTGTLPDTGNPPPNDSGVIDTGTPPPDDASADAIVPIPDSGTFSVATVPGLALWLDANKGVTQSTGKVSGWADQSGNNNNAAQSNAANRPGFTASALNSLPGVHFDMNVAGGTFMTIVDATTLNWATGDYYLVVVARYSNDPNQQGGFTNRIGAFYFKEGTGPTLGPALFGNVTGNPGTSAFATQMSFAAADRLVSTSTGNNNFPKGHAFSVHRGGTTLELRNNGALDGTKTVTAVDVSAPTIDVMLGATPGNGFTQNRLNGDIAEVIAVKGAISSGDLSGIEGYLKAKYAL